MNARKEGFWVDSQFGSKWFASREAAEKAIACTVTLRYQHPDGGEICAEYDLVTRYA